MQKRTYSKPFAAFANPPRHQVIIPLRDGKDLVLSMQESVALREALLEAELKLLERKQP